MRAHSESHSISLVNKINVTHNPTLSKVSDRIARHWFELQKQIF
jgi:hypothetical protein